MILKQCIGIDISKEKFNTCFSIIDDEQKVKVKASSKFSNDSKGFEGLICWTKKHVLADVKLVFVMEATGVYYEQLAWFLYNLGYAVSVVLPTKSKRYIQSVGYKTKNDKIDAKGLAQMGSEQNLNLWQPLSKNIASLRTLTRELESLQSLKTSIGNQIHAIEHSYYQEKSTLRRLGQQLTLIDKQITVVKNQIEKSVNQDELISERVEKMTSIKGVGLITVASLIAETNGFALIENQSQLVSYSGYDIIENQSGKHKGKTRISKKGNSHIRRALFMPAFNMVRYKVPAFTSLYTRLTNKGKEKMQAYVAIQKKLLIVLWTLWKKNTVYDNNYYSRYSGNKNLFPHSNDNKKGKKSEANGTGQINCPAQDEHYNKIFIASSL